MVGFLSISNACQIIRYRICNCAHNVLSVSIRSTSHPFAQLGLTRYSGLPARFSYSRNNATSGQVSKRDTRQSEMTHVPPCTSCQGTPIVQSDRTRIARQLLKTFPVSSRLEGFASLGVLRNKSLPFLFPCYPAFLCHNLLSFCRAYSRTATVLIVSPLERHAKRLEKSQRFFIRVGRGYEGDIKTTDTRDLI